MSLCSVGHFHSNIHCINMSEVPNSASCYERGRVIFEVVLYEYSKNNFSHYIRGCVVIEVVLFSGLYGISFLGALRALGMKYTKLKALGLAIPLASISRFGKCYIIGFVPNQLLILLRLHPCLLSFLKHLYHKLYVVCCVCFFIIHSRY